MGTAAGVRRAPNLRVERELLRGSGAGLLAAIDEVGRGALAGPVTVGVVVVSVETGTAPAGVRDSKLLAPAAREALAPRIRRWALDSATGSATSDEIDGCGIVAALRLAGERALAALGVRPDLVLLDGSHDWLTRPAVQGALDLDGPSGAERALDIAVAEGLVPAPGVVTRVKADLTCSAVAAASVLAKTHRDAVMVRHAEAHPLYGWDENKGYASPEHVAALHAHGPCALHRVSWRLPGQDGPEDVGDPLRAGAEEVAV